MIALLFDIGSTFTKVTAVDCDEAKLLGRSAAPTTINTDVNEGLKQAVTQLEDQIGVIADRADFKLACSSAAGGLKMVAVGLVPGLTAQAAQWAALGAGAKVLQTFVFKLTKQEIDKISELDADIILLAGGTDGGNSDTILHNARMLARSLLDVPIIIAGNKAAQDEVSKILQAAGKDLRITDNVMPQLEELNIEPARETIRALFLERIIHAKGLDTMQRFVDRVVMPTPSAVMDAAQLLAQGDGKDKGWGELLVIDVGGATTDVHSMATGDPTSSGVVLKGLVEPWKKRTVEGDLGIRYSAASLFAAVGEAFLLQIGKELNPNFPIADGNLEDFILSLGRVPSEIYTTEKEIFFETIIGRAAVTAAMNRHAGRLEQIFTPHGEVFLQRGKDLSQVKKIIGTGGILVHHQSPQDILAGAIRPSGEKTLLTPLAGEFFLDKEYIMAAAGLLAKEMPKTAFNLLNRYLVAV
ncbi:glutamate mutase L [Candidatus Acetothermia bacterium]|jgi:uncharacterized protein (TIGR01319 family)|nr:glutamate mutase L [Candidatus Acetothermia bacterium]MCI2427084.1 glutamate mutase L [Candidatus Acetothermia bacterium]MCI2428264.1 glutamate mutase L [Candidatus Acetothermia bacterium]